MRELQNNRLLQNSAAKSTKNIVVLTFFDLNACFHEYNHFQYYFIQK
jgi:hypothetical protein